MISPEKAKSIILKNAVSPQVTKAKLEDCLGAVLARDIAAPFPMPIADNSAMDGFVIRSQDTFTASFKNPVHLKIAGVIKAGGAGHFAMKLKTAFRIMTGALIPKGGDTVIPKEEAELSGNVLCLNQSVPAGRHVRKCGEEFQKDEILIRKNSLIDPAQIGILASLGYSRAPVFRKPRVTLLATGNELLSPGKKISAGKIYDSNSWMIRAALRELGINPWVYILRDEIRLVRAAVHKALRSSDYLILLGGISVGDYDVVKQVLALEHVRTLFWKVNQKPGKPLFLGRAKKSLVFGLPGNPAAALTCFYEYVYPALQKTIGKKGGLHQVKVRIKGPLPRSPRHLFLKAKVVSFSKPMIPYAQILPNQGSHMLSSFADAEGLVSVAPGRKEKDIWFHFFPGKERI